MPAFMSKQPGPVAVPAASSTLNGQRASVPSGQTVSTWPIRATERPPALASAGQRQRRCVRRRANLLARRPR